MSYVKIYKHMGQSAQRAHRPMAQGQSAQRAPWDPQGRAPWDPKGAPWDPKGPPKITIFKNRFFKKISVMLHQWLFYRTYPNDNTIFDNVFYEFVYDIPLPL